MKVCRFTEPVTEESSRGLGRLKVITDIESVRWIHVISGRFKDLAELETVITLTTINIQHRQRVIKDKSVIPCPPVHRNCLNFTIVIDPLKEAAEDRIKVIINFIGGDERFTGRSFLGIRPEEEQIVIIISKDLNRIDSTVIGIGSVIYLNRCSVRCRKSDQIFIRSIITFDFEGRGNA